MFRLIYNKKLLVDSSAEEFARVRANLDEKNIPCYIKTVKVPQQYCNPPMPNRIRDMPCLILRQRTMSLTSIIFMSNARIMTRLDWLME